MGEVAPLRALADQLDFGGALDSHLIFDERRDLLRCRARELCQRRSSIAEHPGIPVLVGSERVLHAHLGQQAAQRFHWMRLRRVLRVIRDVVDARIRLRVFAFKAGHQHAALALGTQDERDRALGGREREAGVVEDVVRVEEDGPGEPVLAQVLGQARQPLVVLSLLDRERHAARSFSRQSGSSSRSRRTRSPTGGCVTNSAASPTSRNGLMV